MLILSFAIRSTRRLQRWISRYPPAFGRLFLIVITVCLAPMHADAFGFDKSITIFENTGLRPSSTREAPDGTLILTIDPAPMVVKLDIAGRMLWKFEERREKGIHADLTGSLPQADGSVIVCVNRESAPGVPFERYPGYLFKLDRNGQEIARFDPMKSPKEQWPFLELRGCVPWGEDFVLVTAPISSNPLSKVNDKNVELGQGDAERGQYLAVRMRGDFSVVWNHPIPAGDFGRIRSQALDNGSLLIAENTTLVGLDQDGNVFNWSAVRNCQLISSFSKNNRVRLLCRESSHPGTPWELRELDERLQITKRFFLPDNTGKYGALTAAGDLSRDRFAIVAINGYYSDLLVFDKSGKELKVISLPTRMELHRSSANIQDIFPQDSGVVAVAHSIQEFLQFSSGTINWIFVGTE